LIKRSVAFLFYSLVASAAYPQEPEKAPPSPTQDVQPSKPAVLRIRMGGGTMRKQLKHKVNPAYPKEAQDQRIQGTVRFHIVVSRDGKVLQAELVSGDPLLAQAALDAVRKWEYKPVLLNGEPVEVDTTVDTVFSLGQ
jgi:protein TonB